MLLFLVLVIILAVIEFQTGFVEKTAGRYLNKRNQGREAWGRSWEKQRSTHEAARKLDEKSVESGRLRARVELATSFRELFSVLIDRQSSPISPAKFVELYLELPAALRRNLINPVELVDLYWSGDWARTTVLLKDDIISAYLINRRNRVIRNVKIARSLVTAAEIYGEITPGYLSDIPEFGGSIYPAERFFNIFRNLSPTERNGIIPDPNILLQLPRPVTRVGIGVLEDAAGYSRLGFESEGFSGSTITSYPALTSVLNHLKWKLVWADSDSIFTNRQSPDTTDTQSDSLRGAEVSE